MRGIYIQWSYVKTDMKNKNDSHVTLLATLPVRVIQLSFNEHIYMYVTFVKICAICWQQFFFASSVNDVFSISLVSAPVM